MVDDEQALFEKHNGIWFGFTLKRCEVDNSMYEYESVQMSFEIWVASAKLKRQSTTSLKLDDYMAEMTRCFMGKNTNEKTTAI